jgi:hypothetical protein
MRGFPFILFSILIFSWMATALRPELSDPMLENIDAAEDEAERVEEGKDEEGDVYEDGQRSLYAARSQLPK